MISTYHAPLNNLSNPTCDRALLRVLFVVRLERELSLYRMCALHCSRLECDLFSAWSAVFCLGSGCACSRSSRLESGLGFDLLMRSCKRICLTFFFCFARLEIAFIYARRWGFDKCGFYLSFSWYCIYLHGICASWRTRLFFLQEKYSNVNMSIYIRRYWRIINCKIIPANLLPRLQADVAVLQPPDRF